MFVSHLDYIFCLSVYTYICFSVRVCVCVRMCVFVFTLLLELGISFVNYKEICCSSSTQRFVPCCVGSERAQRGVVDGGMGAWRLLATLQNSIEYFLGARRQVEFVPSHKSK